VRKADNLPPSCAVVTKSGNLNFLEPYGPVMGLLCLLLVHYQTQLLLVMNLVHINSSDMF